MSKLNLVLRVCKIDGKETEGPQKSFDFPAPLDTLAPEKKLEITIDDNDVDIKVLGRSLNLSKHDFMKAVATMKEYMK